MAFFKKENAAGSDAGPSVANNDPKIEVKKAKNAKPQTKKKKPGNGKSGGNKGSGKKISKEEMKRKKDLAAFNKKRREYLASGISTKEFRDFTGTSIDPTKILYPTLKDKLKGEERPKAEQATENLRKALDPLVRTVFKGTVTGSCKVEGAGKGDAPAYFVLVNSDCGVDGYVGRVIRINIEDFTEDLSTPKFYETNSTAGFRTEAGIESYVTSRIGSEVYFTVTQMDPQDYMSGFVIGSRKAAMRKRRNKYWFGRTKVNGSDEYADLIQEGTIVKANVLAVTNRGVFCEVFGTEAYIPLGELSYRHIMSAKDLFKAGDKINLKLYKIKKEEGHISYSASHKQTMKDPAPSYMLEYLPGDKVKGTVYRCIMQDDGKLFYIVNIANKFEMGAIPKPGIQYAASPGETVAVKIESIDVDMKKNVGRVFGVITHVERSPDFTY